MLWSYTLFKYVFKDLFKVFLMAVGVLSGILSFGGLLRPLTQQGLDATQVGAILTYFTPGMMAYSLPVAALFATTFVYGRLAADNEVVACRAGGLSHLSLALPALVLGLVVALISAGLMLFWVPLCTYKVEEVISSNIAKLIAGRIERTHQIKFGPVTVFAQHAYLPEPWAVLEPAGATSTSGTELKIQRDGTIAAAGDTPPDVDTYTVTAPTDLRGISAIRVEALPDPSLPAGGPGRGKDGSFLLGRVTLTAAPLNDPTRAVDVPLTRATATSDRPDSPAAAAIDADPLTGWAPAATEGDAAPQSVSFHTRDPVGFRGGTELTFKLEQPAGGGRTLGRFRVAVTTPSLQQVILRDVAITTFHRPDKNDKRYKIPTEFYTTPQATVTILRPYDDGDDDGGGGGDGARRWDDDELMLMVGLINGSKFPREFRDAVQVSVGVTQFGPLPISSPIKENTKFMDVWQLRRLSRNHNESRKIRGMVAQYVRRDQEMRFLENVRLDLNDADRAAAFTFAGDAARFGSQPTYILERVAPEEAREEQGEVIVPAPPRPPTEADPVAAAAAAAARAAAAAAESAPPRVRFRREVNGQQDLLVEGAALRLRARPIRDSGTMEVSIEIDDAVSHKQGAAPRRMFTYAFRTPMPPKVKELEGNTYDEYLKADVRGRGAGERQRLHRELTVLENDILSESNARVSFSLSCVILVMVGCALGMMFKSGNFLTAFAVSFVPAMLAITLIVAGQRVCGSVPLEFPTKGSNPVQLGLSLIWSGNVVNLLLACGLWWRMQRQ